MIPKSIYPLSLTMQQTNSFKIVKSKFVSGVEKKIVSADSFSNFFKMEDVMWLVATASRREGSIKQKGLEKKRNRSIN